MASLTIGRSCRYARAFRLLARSQHSNFYYLRTQNVHRTACLLGVKGTELRMPSLSPTMTEGTIIKWLKKEGDSVQPGDVLCEIQTDKAVVAFEVEDAGTLAKIFKDENSGVLPLNTLIGIMVEEGEDWKDVEVPSSAASPDSPPTTAPSVTPAASTATASGPAGGKASLVGPAVKHLLDTYGLKAEDVPATGPHGVLLKSDVLKFVQLKGVSKQVPSPGAVKEAAKVAASVPPPEESEYEDVPLTNMRRAIAKRLTLSKTTIPHSYMNVTCNISETMETRKKYAADGIKVSVNDFIIKAVAMALRRVPAMNCMWQNEIVKPLTTIDISIAVATDSGLITPIVKEADTLGIDEIASTVKELAARARQGKLKPHEFEGGCFSISNLGMFGISQFSAVINPPQAAILAIGGSRMTPREDGAPSQAMAATLSYDGRVVTDETVAGFLKAFKEHLEQPLSMLAMPEMAQHVEIQGL